MTAEEREQVGPWLDQGMSLREITRRLAVPYETVRRWAYRIRPELRKKGRAWTDDDNETLAAGVEAGDSWAAIADRLGRSISSVQVHQTELRRKAGKIQRTMHGDRLDRTGDVYGCVTVLGHDPVNPMLWSVRWECCGKVRAVASERCGHMQRNPTLMCQSCHRDPDRRVVAQPVALEPPVDPPIDPGDIYGLWVRAMGAVRRGAA